MSKSPEELGLLAGIAFFGVPTDAQIEEIFDAVLAAEGDQGESANLEAVVDALVGWEGDRAYRVYRCGVQLYGWDWAGWDREQVSQ